MSIITPDLDRVISVLKRGDIAAIPTETVYGLAGNANNEQAIHKIYALKKRPLNHPLIMHIAKDADLNRWVSTIPDYVATLLSHFWPGPLTLVLPCDPLRVNPLINGGQSTVAIRSPNHPLAQQLLANLDFPLVAPSANQFGKISPTTAQHVQESFDDSDLLILDGGRCSVGIESTIVAATHPEGYQILRQGMINEDMLCQVLPGRQLPPNTRIRVSGNLDTHYQPQKPLYYFTRSETARRFCRKYKEVFILSLQINQDYRGHSTYQLTNNPDIAAYELYYQLREADHSNATAILIELPPDTAAWKGCKERIIKAGKNLESCL